MHSKANCAPTVVDRWSEKGIMNVFNNQEVAVGASGTRERGNSARPLTPDATTVVP